MKIPVYRILAILITVAWIGVVGCTADAPEVESIEAEPDQFFSIRLDNRIIEVQLAVTSTEQRRGLMHRQSMGTDKGMLFVYQRPQQMSYWMRNTPIALDIAFYSSEGIQKEIYPLYPHDETRVVSRSDSLKFALEMNQGWFAINKVRSGAKLDLQDIGKALAQRGFEPGDYGISVNAQ